MCQDTVRHYCDLVIVSFVMLKRLPPLIDRVRQVQDTVRVTALSADFLVILMMFLRLILVRDTVKLRCCLCQSSVIDRMYLMAVQKQGILRENQFHQVRFSQTLSLAQTLDTVSQTWLL